MWRRTSQENKGNDLSLLCDKTRRTLKLRSKMYAHSPCIVHTVRVPSISAQRIQCGCCAAQFSRLKEKKTTLRNCRRYNATVPAAFLQELSNGDVCYHVVLFLRSSSYVCDRLGKCSSHLGRHRVSDSDWYNNNR